MPLLILPFLPVPNELKLGLLMASVLFASVASTVVNPIYNDWLAELVPANARGAFFANRNALATGVGAVVGLAGAYLLDLFRGKGQERAGFTVVFALGLVCAGISMAFFMRMKDLPRAFPIRQGLREGIRAIGQPFGDREFRKVLLFLTLFLLGQTFAGNLFAAYARESLKLDFKVIQGTAVFYALGNVIAARFWGFLADKYGNKPVLAIVGCLLALNPIPWLLTIPGQTTYSAVLLLSTHILMGAVWGGVALCQFNIILATAKPEDRANYIGAGLTVTALMGGVAPLLGAALMAELRTHFDPVVAYKIVFGVTAGLRLLAVLFVLPIAEAGATTVQATLADLRRVTPRGMRAMRTLTRSEDAKGREAAILNVGAEGVRLASDEVIKALHDPQPSVRRRAADALAQLRDPRATEELIHQIEEHPDLLEEETIRALGRLGDPKAIPSLIRTLQSPRSLFRRAAARSLGRIGSCEPLVIEALTRAAADPHDVDLRRASLQALRILNAKESSEVVQRAIHDPHPSVRIAAAEAAAEFDLRNAAPDLRRAIHEFHDEASSELAYTLGVVGELPDIPLILAEAARSHSMITRRRCLLGVARLLGVEGATYRLLLKEGMERDTAVMETLRPVLRRSPHARRALERYSSGDEAEANREMLGAVRGDPARLLAESDVPELFLVMSAYVAARFARTRERARGRAE